MNNNNIHTFTVENTSNSEAVYPEVHMKIDGQATISDMLEAFNCFLKAMGYFPPENHYLDYVSDETETDCFQVKEIQEFGEF